MSKEVRFEKIHDDTEYKRYTYIYHPTSCVFCYGGDCALEGRRQIGVEHADIERWMDSSPEVSGLVDIDNSVRGRIYTDKREMTVNFSTRYWKRDDVKKLIEEIRPQLDETFDISRVTYHGGDYGSDKEQRRRVSWAQMLGSDEETHW